MTKEEKKKIERAIKCFMSDNGYDEGIGILLSLIGKVRAVDVALKDAKVISVYDALRQIDNR